MKLTHYIMVAALSLAPLSAQAVLGTEAGVRGGFWAPQLSGEMRLDGAGTGTTLDLKDDLDLDDSLPDGGVPSLEAFVQFGANRLSLGGAWVAYEGTHDFDSSSVDFGGRTFSGKVDTSWEYTVVEAAYQRTLIDTENWLAGFSLAAIFQVTYLVGEAKLESGPVRESESFGIPMPMAGLGLHAGILMDLLEARVRAMGMGYRGNRAVDVCGELVLSPFPFTDLGIGYRYFLFDVDSDEVVGAQGDMVFDFVQSGPYVALTVKVGL